MSESKRLAAAIHSSLLAETGAKDAGLLKVALPFFEKLLNQPSSTVMARIISLKINRFEIATIKINLWQVS